MTAADLAYRITELERRLSNIFIIGTVSAVDCQQALVRVRCGDLETGWIPWLTHRAGATASFSAPDEGEQVLVLSPDGNVSRAMALPALYQAANPPPTGVESEHCLSFADHALLSYDAGSHRLTIDVTGSGVVKIKAESAQIEGSVTVTGDLSVGGDARVSGDLTAGGDLADSTSSISDDRKLYNQHTHISSAPGAASAPPLPQLGGSS